MPLTGCYLCPETDHWASDTAYHPTRPDKLPKATKAAILARVDASQLSKAAKETEKEAIKAYWAQHSL